MFDLLNLKRGSFYSLNKVKDGYSICLTDGWIVEYEGISYGMKLDIFRDGCVVVGEITDIGTGVKVYTRSATVVDCEYENVIAEELFSDFIKSKNYPKIKETFSRVDAHPVSVLRKSLTEMIGISKVLDGILVEGNRVLV